MTPGNPQRCNSMIDEQSIQRYFYVDLFTDFIYIGSFCSGEHSIRKLPTVNHVYGLLLLDYEVRLVCVRYYKCYTHLCRFPFTTYHFSRSPKHGEVCVKDKLASVKSFW